MTTPTLCTTPIAVAIHRPGDNPIFGESSILVAVDDEAAGPFIALTANSADGESTMRLDPDELEQIVVVARELVDGMNKAEAKP